MDSWKSVNYHCYLNIKQLGGITWKLYSKYQKWSPPLHEQFTRHGLIPNSTQVWPEVTRKFQIRLVTLSKHGMAILKGQTLNSIQTSGSFSVGARVNSKKRRTIPYWNPEKKVPLRVTIPERFWLNIWERRNLQKWNEYFSMNRLVLSLVCTHL